MARYIDATNGDTFGDKVAHYSRDCDDLEGRGRPIAESTVDAAEMDTCEGCSPLGRASDDGTAASDEPAEGTCDVVKSDGEVCGRDRPCRYHD